MARIRSWYLDRPLTAIALTLGLAVLAVVGLIGAARASDQPTFCVSCHEMQPYYDAWEEGAHAGVSCVECHVDAGLAERVSHKAVALGEVWAHVTSDPTFPMAEPASIPDQRCLACHESIEADIAGRSHAEHAGGRACVQCHPTAGHDVTARALIEAGIYDPEAAERRASEVVAAVGQGQDNLAGHVGTGCSDCHDMRVTPCGACHTPTHESSDAACTACHAPAATWVFTHPVSGLCADCHEISSAHRPVEEATTCETCHTARGVDWSFTHPADPACESCHDRGESHTSRGADLACTTCHGAPGQSWSFAHPTADSTCTSCHARPAGHRSGACADCHKVGATWAFDHSASSACQNCHRPPQGHRSGSCTTCHSASAATWRFTHPSRNSTCTTCHAKPSGHRSGSCTSCHAVGSSWKFAHPGSGSTCTTCHSRPSGHNAGSCTSCHTIGKTWSFRHPASTACTSCHRAPANHYGTSCSSCHSPTRSWSSASFSHPRVPGGEHSYRSFACASCHPSGYATYTCTSCHGPEGPDDD